MGSQDMRNKAISELRKALLDLDAAANPVSLADESKHEEQFKLRVRAQMRFHDAAQPWVIRELLNRMDACAPENTDESEDLGEAVTLLAKLSRAVSDHLDPDWDESTLHPRLKPAHCDAQEWLLERELKRYADGIFSSDGASEWIRKPHPSLNGKSPLAISMEGGGLSKVLEILNAIKHGGVA